MITLFCNSEHDWSPFGATDPFKPFRQASEKSREIGAGMSPDEIADIVSDRIMKVIQKQFKETEERFREKEKKG